MIEELDELDDEQVSQEDPKIDQLLLEIGKSRDELNACMGDVSNMREKIIDILPKDHDFRNKFVLEEKLKITSSFYSTLLNIRQEYNKLLKEEIEIRRKRNMNKGPSGISEGDIRNIAEQLSQ